MTSIAPASSPNAAATSTTRDATKAQVDYNAFLKLFIASMKNQDPTKPNDPAATLSQLASFSNVEQSIKLNEKLDTLVASSGANVAAALLGKRLSSLDGSVRGIATGFETSASGLAALLDTGKTLSLTDGYKVESA